MEKAIADHCEIRKRTLHAVSCRTNHVHVAVTAPGRKIEVPREQFKAWCTRKLNEHSRSVGAIPADVLRDHWWTERGWDEYIDTDRSLGEVASYIGEGQ